MLDTADHTILQVSLSKQILPGPITPIDVTLKKRSLTHATMGFSGSHWLQASSHKFDISCEHETHAYDTRGQEGFGTWTPRSLEGIGINASGLTWRVAQAESVARQGRAPLLLEDNDVGIPRKVILMSPKLMRLFSALHTYIHTKLRAERIQSKLQ